MKATLFAMFVALLMVGCGGEAQNRAKKKFESQMAANKLNEELLRNRMDPNVNETRKTSSAFRDLTLEQLLEEVSMRQENFPEGKAFPSSSSSYNNSKHHRLKTSWYENGQKESVINFKDGDPDGPWTEWYENGRKEGEGSFKDGKEDGLWIAWYENGQKKREMNFKVGKLMSAKAWKPNGEKCPLTNVKDGNGVWVSYYDDGTEDIRWNYKDGKRVRD